jgi:flagellar hook-associated protein 1 FlgK
MSGSLFGILNTARTGLFAQQAGMNVTGNNIANANTPGYTRQRAVFGSIATGGVELRGSQRLRDEYVTARLLGSNARLAGRESSSINLSQIESVMGETQSSGLSKSLQQFFNSLQSLSQKPGGVAEREEVRSSTSQLATAFGYVTGQLRQIRGQIDQQVAYEVEKVNDLTARIVELNAKIGTSSGDGSGIGDATLNDLLDQRDRLLTELSEVVPLRTITARNGTLTIFMGEQVLVEGNARRTLSLRVDPINEGLHDVILDGLGGGLPLKGKLKEGKLAALIDVRDNEAGKALREVERLAGQLVRDFNVIHRAGTGLDNVTGRDFFTGLAASATRSADNKGGTAATAASIFDDTALTFSDYEIRFTGPAQFDVINTSTGVAVSTGNAYVSGANIDFDGLRVVIGNDTGAPAAGDVYQVNSYTGIGNRIDMDPAISGDLQAIAAGLTSAPGDNENALQLIALRDQATMGQPASQTYEAFYDSLRVRNAMTTAAAHQALADEEIANHQLITMADGLSGVSLDEEATHLIEYQRAFQAASRVISVTDELMQSLLQMV